MAQNFEFTREKTKPLDQLYIHVTKTYEWMFLGLLVTFATAFALIGSGLIIYAFITP